MLAANRLVKSAWIAVDITKDRAERVLVVEAYIAVSPLEKDFDAHRYEKVVEDVRRVLAAHPEIDRASILSMHRDAGCTALFRSQPAHSAA
ncbi:hypothetical protein ABEV34_27470 [Methylorubrum rhodesianum]|jgi:hypothetical protein|uniref:Uncharacterized protein n=1 Tax=Methylorubrum rhodesianum TaxID=29427 RepID=A0ABU9ZDX7_9HYPH|nr:MULTISPECIES: hypothetical protein [Methylorubrum]MBB5762991.1 hypothetical protein [Methylorubrum rhodesianum]MBI1688719.1 hypothetical protein [Methylorubrum sp. DB1722]MBK3404840.1 hypothetical protein [Methylorubrum rhodesianum]MBY0142783.1 hypothetical protein [Methylorubrum populi]